jgi:hypothetical protein
MKSDWDDAPDYMRNNKKQSPWRTVVILGVGSALTWGLVALFAKPIVIDVDQLKNSIRFGGQPLFSQQPTEQYSPPARAIQEAQLPFESATEVARPTISRAEMEWFEENEAFAIERANNIYNDKNYKPKQPQNTYSPPATQQIAAAPVVRERKQRPVSRERTAKWIKSWNGGTNYLAEWVVVDNYIDSTSVCANHRSGSIDYRECRKAAKQHYHEECKTWRARYDNDRKDNSDRMKTRYCSASSNFSPMG